MINIRSKNLVEMNEIFLGGRIYRIINKMSSLVFIKGQGVVALELASKLLKKEILELEVIKDEELELIEIILGLERSLLFWNNLDYTKSNHNKKLGNWFSRNEQRRLQTIDKIQSLLRFYLNKEFLSNVQRTEAKKLIARANLLGA